MAIHNDPHNLAGKTVEVVKGKYSGEYYRVEDWWDRVSGKSWMFCNGNPAAMLFGIRSGAEGLPLDNEVLYGKIGAFGHLIHTSEIGKVVEVGE